LSRLAPDNEEFVDAVEQLGQRVVAEQVEFEWAQIGCRTEVEFGHCKQRKQQVEERVGTKKLILNV
jgi:hypothetical protein